VVQVQPAAVKVTMRQEEAQNRAQTKLQAGAGEEPFISTKAVMKSFPWTAAKKEAAKAEEPGVLRKSGRKPGGPAIR
jgi:hypothetical protein